MASASTPTAESAPLPPGQLALFAEFVDDKLRSVAGLSQKNTTSAVSVTGNALVMCSNSGLVRVLSAPFSGEMQLRLSFSLNSSARLLALSPSQRHLACALSSGHIEVYELHGNERTRMQTHTRVRTNRLHVGKQVTCLCWTRSASPAAAGNSASASATAGLLFAGDANGLVTSTSLAESPRELFALDASCEQVITLPQDAPVHQLDTGERHELLVSTRARALLCNIESRTFFQLGSASAKPRPGAYGACLCPRSGRPCGMYAARPKHRLWQLTTESNKVISTHIYSSAELGAGKLLLADVLLNSAPNIHAPSCVPNAQCSGTYRQLMQAGASLLIVITDQHDVMFIDTDSHRVVNWLAGCSCVTAIAVTSDAGGGGRLALLLQDRHFVLLRVCVNLAESVACLRSAAATYPAALLRHLAGQRARLLADPAIMVSLPPAYLRQLLADSASCGIDLAWLLESDEYRRAHEEAVAEEPRIRRTESGIYIVGGAGGGGGEAPTSSDQRATAPIAIPQPAMADSTPFTFSADKSAAGAVVRGLFQDLGHKLEAAASAIAAAATTADSAGVAAAVNGTPASTPPDVLVDFRVPVSFGLATWKQRSQPSSSSSASPSSPAKASSSPTDDIGLDPADLIRLEAETLTLHQRLLDVGPSVSDCIDRLRVLASLLAELAAKRRRRLASAGGTCWLGLPGDAAATQTATEAVTTPLPVPEKLRAELGVLLAWMVTLRLVRDQSQSQVRPADKEFCVEAMQGSSFEASLSDKGPLDKSVQVALLPSALLTSLPPPPFLVDNFELSPVVALLAAATTTTVVASTDDAAAAAAAKKAPALDLTADGLHGHVDWSAVRRLAFIGGDNPLLSLSMSDIGEVLKFSWEQLWRRRESRLAQLADAKCDTMLKALEMSPTSLISMETMLLLIRNFNRYKSHIENFILNQLHYFKRDELFLLFYLTGNALDFAGFVDKMLSEKAAASVPTDEETRETLRLLGTRGLLALAGLRGGWCPTLAEPAVDSDVGTCIYCQFSAHSDIELSDRLLRPAIDELCSRGEGAVDFQYLYSFLLARKQLAAAIYLLKRLAWTSHLAFWCVQLDSAQLLDYIVGSGANAEAALRTALATVRGRGRRRCGKCDGPRCCDSDAGNTRAKQRPPHPAAVSLDSLARALLQLGVAPLELLDLLKDDKSGADEFIDSDISERHQSLDGFVSDCIQLAFDQQQQRLQREIEGRAGTAASKLAATAAACWGLALCPETDCSRCHLPLAFGAATTELRSGDNVGVSEGGDDDDSTVVAFQCGHAFHWRCCLRESGDACAVCCW